MKPASSSRWAGFTVAVFLAVAAGFAAERAVRQDMNRLRSEPGDSALAWVELLREIRGALTAARVDETAGEQSPTADRANRLAECAGRLQTLSRRMTQAGPSAARDALVIQLQAALTHSVDATESALVPGERSALAGRMVAWCDELQSIVEGESLRQQAARSAALVTVRRVWLFSLLLAAVAGMLATAALYRRRLAPLRAQLSESRTHLERHEKLASLGVFAAGIAHEIRNPLTAIKVRLFSLKRSVPNESSVRDDVRVIGDELNRLEHIVEDFLRFARPPELQCRLLNAQHLLRDAGCLLEPQLSSRSVRLVQELASEAWVWADPEKMKQVLINMIQNAEQSIEGKGVVTLRLSQDRRVLARRLVDVVILEIADTGKGMLPEVVKRLFDPFFTTKEDGTGLGLPIAARIVEQHGGLIEYDTQPQRGTTFRIVLPRATPHEETSPRSAD